MPTPASGAPPAPAPARPKSRKTLWIILGIVGFILICIIAFAAFGLYFVSRNLDMQQVTATEAAQSFEETRARFKESPIIDVDDQRRVRLMRPVPTQPPAQTPETMHVMAYDTDDSRIVRLTIPFWMLRMGREKIRLGKGSDLEFEQLQLTTEQLERYGPALLLDHRGGGGARVLVWTQ